MTALNTIDLEDGIANPLAEAGYTSVEEVLETLASGGKIKGIGEKRMADLTEALSGYSLEDDKVPGQPEVAEVPDSIAKAIAPKLWERTDRPVNVYPFLVQPRGLDEDTLVAADESEAWSFYCVKHSVANRTKYRRKITKVTGGR